MTLSAHKVVCVQKKKGGEAAFIEHVAIIPFTNIGSGVSEWGGKKLEI